MGKKDSEKQKKEKKVKCKQNHPTDCQALAEYKFSNLFFTMREKRNALDVSNFTQVIKGNKDSTVCTLAMRAQHGLLRCI